MSAQILEDKFGNKYYYQKIEGEATSLRVLFVSDPHGNTYKTSHVIALKKELEKNHPEDHTLLLWGGDEPTGYPIWAFRKNEIGYSIWAKHSDVAVIGNHDLIHYPLSNIDRLINQKGLKFLATNISSVGTKKKTYPYPRYKIIELSSGEKILVLGMVTQSINTDDRISDKIYMETPSKEYNNIVTQVESIYGPISKIFLLAHFERKLSPEKGEDLETFARKIINNNLIVFKGHDHKDGNYYLESKDGLIPIIESGEALDVIKYVKLSAKTLLYKGHLDKHIRDIDADPETDALIRVMKQNIPIPLQYDVLSEYLFDGSNRAWTFSRAEIDTRPENANEILLNTPLTALILDAYRYSVSANLAMLESGNVRSGIAKKQNVTGMDMYKVIPFENDIVKSQITGAALENLINNNYNSDEQRILARGIVQAYDEVNNKLVIKKVYNPTTKNFETFNPEALYTVSSIDHFAKKHSLNIIQEKTEWKDYAAIISYIRFKNKFDQKQTWVEKYQNDYYYCNVKLNGNFGNGVRLSVESSESVSETFLLKGEQYYKLYKDMTVDEMLKELDLLIPELKKLNNGYLFGLSPAEDVRDAAELVSSASNIYNVWGNIYPHDRNAGLLVDYYSGNVELAYNDWSTRLRTFILLSRLFKKLYPNDPKLADIWSSYVDLRIKSDEFTESRSKNKGNKGNGNAVKGVSKILIEHSDIKDEAKQEITELLNNHSKVGQKLPYDVYEKLVEYNNKLINLIKGLYDSEGVKYHTEIINTQFGKYLAIVYDTQGSHYINKVAGFRANFNNTKLLYLPAIFILTKVGAQYDPEKNLLYVSEDFAKVVKDYKNTIHEDIHLFFKSMWDSGRESDLNGVLLRNINIDILGKNLYDSDVSMDEVSAYTESIFYELRLATRVETPSKHLAYSKSYLEIVTKISSEMIRDLLIIQEAIKGKYQEAIWNIQYMDLPHDQTFFFEKASTVKAIRRNGLNNEYTELLYSVKGLTYKTMTQVLNPDISTIREKIDRQLALLNEFHTKFTELKKEIELLILPETTPLDVNSEMGKDRLNLLVNQAREIRKLYNENIGVDKDISFKDIILDYVPVNEVNEPENNPENNSNNTSVIRRSVQLGSSGSMNNTDALGMLSLHTGSSSIDLMEQLEILMQQWVDNEGILSESDRLLLFGEENKPGIYDYVYKLVLDGTASNVEDLKFFLILSGAVSWHNQATTNYNFGSLGRDAIKLISTSYISFGLNSQVKMLEVDKAIDSKVYIKSNTRFVDFFKTGITAVNNYNKNMIKK